MCDIVWYACSCNAVAAAPCLATGENALHQQQLVKWPHQSSRKMTILRIADSSSTLHSPWEKIAQKRTADRSIASDPPGRLSISSCFRAYHQGVAARSSIRIRICCWNPVHRHRLLLPTKMITGGDLYSVLSAVVPLYVAMLLAYGSVKWWGILTPQQCMGVNRFVSIFAVPLLSFQFISGNDPYAMNFRFIAADAVSKIALLLFLALWVRYSKSGSLDWMITIFMLGTLPNTLVMGTPLLAAMYGAGPGSLTVQAVVLQCIIWYTLLLVMYEYRAAKILILEQFPDTAASIVSFKVDSDVMSLDGREPVLTEAEFGDDGKLHVTVRRSVSVRSPSMQSGTYAHSSRSMGITPSSKALTPRPSNLTGAEIYSLQSSRNPTPRDSSFNQNEFYSMMMLSAGRSPQHHRQSNFTSSDIYSLQSSRGPTPRTSNFNEENSKEVRAYPKGGAMNNMINSPRFVPPLYRGGGVVAGGGRMHGRGGVGGSHEAAAAAPLGGGVAAAAAAGGEVRGGPHPGSNNGTAGSGNNTTVVVPPVQSAGASQISRLAMDARNSPRRGVTEHKGAAAAPPKVPDEDARELHMFVWSANASPVAERGLHVFGANSPPARHEFDPKELRLLVHQESDPALDAGEQTSSLHMGVSLFFQTGVLFSWRLSFPELS